MDRHAGFHEASDALWNERDAMFAGDNLLRYAEDHVWCLVE
jgi:hypothetical protein